MKLISACKASHEQNNSDLIGIGLPQAIQFFVMIMWQLWQVLTHSVCSASFCSRIYPVFKFESYFKLPHSTGILNGENQRGE